MNEWEWQLLEQTSQAASVRVDGIELRQGDRVRLRPHAGGDIMDLALAGQIATVESIEQDYEGRMHVAVVLEADPGRDLGMLREPGHRFFFAPEEVQPCARGPKILIAGIGNIFLGDDSFGCEVARRLEANPPKENVRVRDFGIRSYDLAYALLEDNDLVILVDACSRGGAPGTVYVIEPDLKSAELAAAALDAHAMNTASVLRLAQSLGTVSARILLVACEPATLGGEEGHVGLSEPVAAAVDPAVATIQELIAKASTCA